MERNARKRSSRSDLWALGERDPDERRRDRTPAGARKQRGETAKKEGAHGGITGSPVPQTEGLWNRDGAPALPDTTARVVTNS